MNKEEIAEVSNRGSIVINKLYHVVFLFVFPPVLIVYALRYVLSRVLEGKEKSVVTVANGAIVIMAISFPPLLTAFAVRYIIKFVYGNLVEFHYKDMISEENVTAKDSNDIEIKAEEEK